MPTETFTPDHRDWTALPIQRLGLNISGSPLESLLAEFKTELERVSIRRVKPVFYLSTEWGVPFDTVAIAIPFYLAHPELTKVHAERVGHIEGFTRADILRYVRHEMGHVINYAYRLYDREDWTRLFGAIDQPYIEEYTPSPFSRRFVRHLPGWYAQKHPDEDWAETFAVWMTPARDWRADYADWPIALAKLECCDRILTELRDKEPIVTAADLDEDVAEMTSSIDQYYAAIPEEPTLFPRVLDGTLRVIFEDRDRPDDSSPACRLPASGLIRSLEQELMAQVYYWTGHFPERTRSLLRHLAHRADALDQVYPEDRAPRASVALTALVTALAMNYIHHGEYWR